MMFRNLAFLTAIIAHVGCTTVSPERTQNFKPNTEKSWIGNFAAMQALESQGFLAREAEDHLSAAKFFEAAADHSLAIPSDAGMYNRAVAVWSHVASGNDNAALNALNKLADEGFRYPNIIVAAPGLEEFLAGEEAQLEIDRIKQNAEDYRRANSNPDTSSLVFEDIDRFWQAYDAASDVEGVEAKTAIFVRDYLTPGSPGLIDFFRIKIGTAEKLVEKIEESKGYYEGIRSQTLKVPSLETDIRDGMRKLQAIYPSAYFPPATFVIGRLSSGGTAGPEGLLMGVEVASWKEGVPLDGISPGFQKLVMSWDLNRLPMVVVHEQVHGMQNYGGKTSLLRSILQEGTADFLAELAFPNAEPSAYFTFGLENEARIWDRLSKELKDGKYRDWLGNNGRTDMGDDWHPDLGYFVGSRIARAYYNQADDKQAAIEELLNVTDAFAVLEKSGYASKFDK